ncbi:hypothetical protein ANTPLA_LOCUS8507 [Anthophora plagiata]
MRVFNSTGFNFQLRIKFHLSKAISSSRVFYVYCTFPRICLKVRNCKKLHLFVCKNIYLRLHFVRCNTTDKVQIVIPKSDSIISAVINLIVVELNGTLVTKIVIIFLHVKHCDGFAI